MSVRKLLPIAVLLAAVSIRCGGSPSEPAGTVSVTVTTTTTTTTTIPVLAAGAVSASPAGIGLAAATVYTFAFATPPSGGVPPYTYAWSFGDGAEGSGIAPSHVYANTGDFTATVTVTDTRGETARASTGVPVRSVTGRWTATFEGATAPQSEPIDLVQNQTAVTATINDTANALGFGSGAGNVSNPRSLSISATFGAGSPTALGVTFVGRIDDALTTWTGTATGYTGCPCAFTAKRPAIAGDTLGMSIPIGR
jgi:hypothetical protein